MESVRTPPSRGSRIRGSLLAGAVGDALGASIEFDSLEAIRRDFGPEGLRDYAPAYGREAGAITDDTQMTLFVAEGLVLAARAGALHRPSERLRILHRAHLRWLHTQGVGARHPSFPGIVQEGWLLPLDGTARAHPAALVSRDCEARGWGGWSSRSIRANAVAV